MTIISSEQETASSSVKKIEIMPKSQVKTKAI